MKLSILKPNININILSSFFLSMKPGSLLLDDKTHCFPPAPRVFGLIDSYERVCLFCIKKIKQLVCLYR